MRIMLARFTLIVSGALVYGGMTGVAVFFCHVMHLGTSKNQDIAAIAIFSLLGLLRGIFSATTFKSSST